MKMRLVLLMAGLLSLPFAAQAKAQGRETEEVSAALSRFLQAFDNLDWDRFRNAFADDATVFYPREFPRRAEGRAEFEKNFRQVFEQIRQRAQKAPYMDIQPRELRIRRFGNVALITFHLDDRPGVLGRRTVIMEKRRGAWKIVHLHASEVALGAAGADQQKSKDLPIALNSLESFLNILH